MSSAALTRDRAELDGGAGGRTPRFRRGRRGAWSPELPVRGAVLLALPLLAGLVLFVGYPLVKLVIDSVTQGDGFANYRSVMESAALRRALVTTLLDSALVTALCLIMGGALAWTLRVTRRRMVAAVLWAAVLVPLWMGVVVKNYAFAFLLSKDGVVNELLVGLGFVDAPQQLMYTQGAVVAGMTYAMLPYAVFAIYAVLALIDLELLNAARITGASRLGALTSIAFPLALPGIVAAAAVVFAISIGFYVTPILLGGAQTPFMASVIDDSIFNYFDYPRAAASAVILLAIAVVILGVAARVVGADRLRRAVS